MSGLATTQSHTDIGGIPLLVLLVRQEQLKMNAEIEVQAIVYRDGAGVTSTCGTALRMYAIRS